MDLGWRFATAEEEVPEQSIRSDPIHLTYNNGVYKSGASMKQEAYEEAVEALFAALDRGEAQLASSPNPFYYGWYITESDVRLYVTVVRFDPVYHRHFKCSSGTFGRAIRLSTSGCEGFIRMKMPPRARRIFSKSKITIPKAISD